MKWLRKVSVVCYAMKRLDPKKLCLLELGWYLKTCFCLKKNYIPIFRKASGQIHQYAASLSHIVLFGDRVVQTKASARLTIFPLSNQVSRYQKMLSAFRSNNHRTQKRTRLSWLVSSFTVVTTDCPQNPL